MPLIRLIMLLVFLAHAFPVLGQSQIVIGNCPDGKFKDSMPCFCDGSLLTQEFLERDQVVGADTQISYCCDNKIQAEPCTNKNQIDSSIKESANPDQQKCNLDSDCLWFSDGACKGCWKKGAVDYSSFGKCVQHSFCVCENSRCQYPSEQWIKAHSQISIERCSAVEFIGRLRCYSHVSEILDDPTICDKIESQLEREECRRTKEIKNRNNIQP